MNSVLLTDGYKVGHKFMVPPGTQMMYSNMTPRSGKWAPKGCDEVVSFGQQMLVRKIHDHWFKNFFSKPKEEVCQEAAEELTLYLNYKVPYDVSHMEALHDLGYLPLEFKSITEGELIPYGVPMFTVQNTVHLEKGVYDWITNYLETIFSCEGWKAPTAATIGRAFRQLGLKYAYKTDKENLWFVDWQFHDFSMRGIDGLSGVINTSLGHATSHFGSDSLPAIGAARKFYNMPRGTFVIGSVNASEHSVMSAGIGLQGELETYRRLLKTFPEGILSLVSDTMDLWLVITWILVELKDQILARDGKLVIRPDTGDPVKILTGWYSWELEEYEGEFYDTTQIIKIGDKYQPSAGAKPIGEHERKGVIQLLWEIFGGTTNAQGYKKLNDKIGAIYGDSINLDRAEEIFERLEKNGFASTNVVLGVGSFTYQYVTRDTLGFAVKATMVNIDGIDIPIFKDPVTGDGTKKSAKGYLAVFKDENGKLYLKDQCTKEEADTGELTLIYKDGKFFNETSLTNVRELLKTKDYVENAA